MRFTLTKADRLLKRSEFLRLSKYGRRVHNAQFIACFSRGQHGRSRLGMTVTKKVGGAVERNRIKRLVREYFRLNRHFFAGDWDINIIAKKAAADLSSEKLFESLQNIFKRITDDGDH